MIVDREYFGVHVQCKITKAFMLLDKERYCEEFIDKGGDKSED